MARGFCPAALAVRKRSMSWFSLSGAGGTGERASRDEVAVRAGRPVTSGGWQRRLRFHEPRWGFRAAAREGSAATPLSCAPPGDMDSDRERTNTAATRSAAATIARRETDFFDTTDLYGQASTVPC
jgi:hypothetical protein